MNSIIERCNGLQKKLNYTFNDTALLEEAISHSSYINERSINKKKCNERMEFLGDAVLELISSEYLYKKYDEMAEGELTKLRASLVCEKSLATCARRIELGSYIMLGHGEIMNKGNERDSILADAFEAVIGAVYLDGGKDAAAELISNTVLLNEYAGSGFADYKTELQEYIQKNGQGRLEYRLVREEGPDHDKRFVVELFIDDIRVGSGEGKNKKTAEQSAAEFALKQIKKAEDK